MHCCGILAISNTPAQNPRLQPNKSKTVGGCGSLAQKWCKCGTMRGYTISIFISCNPFKPTYTLTGYSQQYYMCSHLANISEQLTFGHMIYNIAIY